MRHPAADAEALLPHLPAATRRLSPTRCHSRRGTVKPRKRGQNTEPPQSGEGTGCQTAPAFSTLWIEAYWHARSLNNEYAFHCFSIIGRAGRTGAKAWAGQERRYYVSHNGVAG